jgi:hypothetical protein
VSARHPSPLVRLLQDPSRELAHAATVLLHELEQLLPFALALVALACVLATAWLVLVHVREERRAGGARLLELAVPPELESEGALLLWSSLHDLLRPRFARLLTGQPQLAWEIAADRTGSRFRIWIPGSVPPGLIERTLAAAWPGITTTAAPAPTTEDAADANGDTA